MSAPETVTEPSPDGNPVLAAATEAIVRRRLASTHRNTTDPHRARVVILLDALPDAAAAIEAAAPLIRADERQRLADREEMVAEVKAELDDAFQFTKPDGSRHGYVTREWVEALIATQAASASAAAIGAQVGADLTRQILVAVCQRDRISLASVADPGQPAWNYELALRLGIGRVFGLPDGDPA